MNAIFKKYAPTTQQNIAKIAKFRFKLNKT